MHKLAFVLSAPIILSGACTSDVREEIGVVGDAVKDPLSLANLVAGACATACLMVAAGQCDWQSQCSEDYRGAGMGPREAWCGSTALSCSACRYADEDTAAGVMGCYRSCAGLH
jgi:hypothetical protein